MNNKKNNQAESSTLSKSPSNIGVLFREFKKDKVATTSLFYLILLFVFVFIAAQFIDPKEFTRVVIGKKMQYMKPDLSSYKYLLGTDIAGRSVFYQLIGGARNSILIGFSVSIISNIIGVAVGLTIGYFGGKIDYIVMRFIDFILILPILLLIIVFVSIVPQYSMWHFVAIMSAFSWLGTARLVRSKSLSESRRDYISASKTMGTKNWKIIFGSVLPNISSIVIVNLTLGLAGSIGIETGLTFLGFGLPAGTPSLGTLIAYARDSQILTVRPWIWLPASLLILTMMLSINYVGQALRRASDAKQRLG